MAINNTVENINNQPTIEPRTVTGIFTRYIAKTLPLAFDESMSYYECLCALLEYLNEDIVPDINNTNEGLEELQGFYLDLQNYVNTYFDNLDVQDEINNKLDEMVEDGSLTAIIKNYVDPIINDFENEINETVNNQNNMINNINTKVNASVGINPLPAATLADMTDTTRIYVLETDGNWYYYDGNSWEAGGVYQSTEYGENTIPSKSINNLVYDKVNNNLTIGTLSTSNFTNLSNTTISEDSTSITIRRTSTSSNAQFRINFSFDEVQLGKTIIFNVSNLRCMPSVNIVTSSNKSVYPIWKNGKSVIQLEAEDVKATTTLIISLYANQYGSIVDGDIILTIDKDYQITDSTFYDYANSNNLSTILNNLTNYNGITNRYDYINFILPFDTSASILQVIRTNNNYTISTSANNGVKTNWIYKTNSTLHIKGTLTNLSNSITVYLLTREANNTPHYNPWNFNPGDTIDLSLDLAYYSVYQNMTNFRIIINTVNGTAYINNLVMYVDDLSDMEIYSNNLGDTLKNIQNKFYDIDSEISQNQLILTSPNNTKYRLTVSNDGTLGTAVVSTIATKGLFIGNSLLVGFGTHGMASYSVNDDYYHYVNEYLKSKNSNFTSTKLLGGEWEGATNETQVNNFINNSLIPAMAVDTDIVFIQLGDNCNTSEKINYIPTKAPMLIEAIKRINPNAVIYWVASWYNTSAKQNNIINVCNTYGIKYINIAPLSIPENMAYIGYEYIDRNGVVQTIDNAGVASHPSSVGMKKIADLIIENL